MIGVNSGARKYFERRYLCRRHRVFINGETATDCPGGSVSITGDAFEQVVWWMVVKILTDGKTLPDAVASLRARADSRIEAHTKKREALRDAIARCEETVAVNSRLMQASARQDERFAETKQFAMWRLEVQQAEDDIKNYEKDLAKIDGQDEPMERHLQVLDRLAARQHNEAMATLLGLDVEGKRQILREMNLRVIVWNKASNPRWGIRIGAPDSPLVVSAQLAPTAALTKDGPGEKIMPDGMEYQHYIWHEIAGRVSQLLVAYGAEDALEDERDAAQDS
jgi:hypothetical protein